MIVIKDEKFENERNYHAVKINEKNTGDFRDMILVELYLNEIESTNLRVKVDLINLSAKN